MHIFYIGILPLKSGVHIAEKLGKPSSRACFRREILKAKFDPHPPLHFCHRYCCVAGGQ